MMHCLIGSHCKLCNGVRRCVTADFQDGQSNSGGAGDDLSGSLKDPHHSVKELARLAILTDCTLMLAWNAEEAGRYLETYKAYENKPADALKEKVEQNHISKMTDCLTTVKSVNKTDVTTLLANCRTFEKIVESSKEELALLPGFGPQKAQRLSSIFTEPFLRRNKRRKVQNEEENGDG
ncbi:DNA excision repair protein ERCC-1-like [Lytechinus pictus]|uniref:DNA excision repair protein ERCC-1-like n=1 Tax=Lytechinus pictus TaxID=7653 RepID=UPI0030B9C14F